MTPEYRAKIEQHAKLSGSFYLRDVLQALAVAEGRIIEPEPTQASEPRGYAELSERHEQ